MLRVMVCDTRKTTLARRDCGPRARTVFFSILAFATGALLCLGSAKGRPATSALMQSHPDRQLRHPALKVVNRSPEPLLLAMRGPVDRRLVAPPLENTRTLLAAGVYKVEVRQGGRVVRKGRVLLKKGHRYLLEIGP